MSTDVVVRDRTFDLTRAPGEQWNAEMIDLVSRNVFRNMQITEQQLYYCLAIADSVNLNPLIGEVYFIPGKSRDGRGPAWQAYVGRNGLVKKAAERGAYYEAETVRKNDRFRMTRKASGEVVVTHSYGSEDRGQIIGAYAFLNFRNGDKPAFFYARWEEYAPKLEQHKFDLSPWGNQESAMMEKCAMIGAGRKRLDLGNLLADGEITRVGQQQAGELPRSSATAAVSEPVEVEWSKITEDPELAARLKAATEACGWPAARVEMSMQGRTRTELERLAGELERLAGGIEASHQSGEEIADAEIVPSRSREDQERIDALTVRLGTLEERQARTDSEEEAQQLGEEITRVQRERAAIADQAQSSLL